MKITVKDILDNSDAKLLIGSLDVEIKDCIVNSKQKTKDGTFFGIKGNNKDGSYYYKEAFNNGAKVCVISKILDLDLKGYDDKTVIVAKNVFKTLQDIASYKRSLFKGKVIGITGSVGKTTTKNMITGVLKSKYNVLSTNKNENSQIGVPLTILKLQEEDIMVLEMGMSIKGEMNRLSKIVRPDIACITNVGDSHAGNFDSRFDILNAKLEILDWMENGILLKNNDDLLLNEIDVLKNINTISFGIKNKSDLMITNILKDKNGFIFNFEGIKDICIKGPYSYLYNAAFSVLIGKMFEINDEKIKEALLNFNNEKHRLEIIKLNNGINLIDDSYNASYESVKSALEYLKNYDSRKVAILGDVLELGSLTKITHKKLGKLVIENSVDVLITVGTYSKEIQKEVKKRGFKKENLYHYSNYRLLNKHIKYILKEKDTVLIKASNKLGLVNTVEYLKGYVKET